MATVHVLQIKVGVNWAVAFPLYPGFLGSSAGFTSAAPQVPEYLCFVHHHCYHRYNILLLNYDFLLLVFLI